MNKSLSRYMYHKNIQHFGDLKPKHLSLDHIKAVGDALITHCFVDDPRYEKYTASILDAVDNAGWNKQNVFIRRWFYYIIYRMHVQNIFTVFSDEFDYRNPACFLYEVVMQKRPFKQQMAKNIGRIVKSKKLDMLHKILGVIYLIFQFKAISFNYLTNNDIPIPKNIFLNNERERFS